MAQTDGEKELVLGNKQLISLFFVVVALCGVFFAMGYLVGLNSAKAPMASGNDSSSTAGAAAGQRPQPGSLHESPAQADTPSAPASDSASPTGVETKPAQDTAAGPSASVEPEPKMTTPILSKRATSAVSTVIPAVSGSGAAPLLESGASYLQVAALQQRTDAENVIRTLREQSLPAVAVRNPKDGLFHVLVGPYREMTQVAEAKTRLRTLGFANAFVQKQ
jgi:cell division septation protein DedD